MGRSGKGGRRGLRGIMFTTHGVRGQREDSAAQRRHMVTKYSVGSWDGKCEGIMGKTV